MGRLGALWVCLLVAFSLSPAAANAAPAGRLMGDEALAQAVAGLDNYCVYTGVRCWVAPITCPQVYVCPNMPCLNNTTYGPEHKYCSGPEPVKYCYPGTSWCLLTTYKCRERDNCTCVNVPNSTPLPLGYREAATGTPC